MGYVQYNLFESSCTSPVKAADDTNELKCCAVASYNKSITPTACAADKLCNYAEGKMCPRASWIASANDSQNTRQCCAEACRYSACTAISPLFSICNLTKESCSASDKIYSSDSYANTQQCCKSLCMPKPSLAPQGTTGGSCYDILKNQDETDKDCGGTICGKCGVDKSCLTHSDCISNICSGGKCSASLPETGPCTVSGKQVPIGYRKGDTEFCNVTGWSDQLGKDAKCGNDYECKSNLCSSGRCTQVRETLALIPRIWCWLQAWILNPTSAGLRQDKICDCLIPDYIKEAKDIPESYPEHEFC
jgi:hypothetical protein